MSELSAPTSTRMRDAGISPELVAAIGLEEVGPNVLEVPFKRVGGRTVVRRWSAAGDWELDPWPEGEPPSAWWPMGRDAGTVIVCLGVGSGLLLASLLFRVGRDGAIYRPDLPPVLRGAVPLVLADACGGLLVDRTEDPQRGVEELFGELMNPDLRLVFLATPRRPSDLQPIAADEGHPRSFNDLFVETGINCELVPTLAQIPTESSWLELLAPFRGPAKALAIAGTLTYLQAHAVDVPDPKGPTP